MVGLMQPAPSRGPSGPDKRILVIVAMVALFVILIIVVPMVIMLLSNQPHSDPSPRLRCLNEIGWFDTAIQNFKNTYKVDYNSETRAYLLGVIEEMRAAMQQADAHRNHEQPGRCRACAYRQLCDESLW